MKILLTEAEIREAVWGKENYDHNIAKAQLKKVVEWGNELCPHSEVMRDGLIYHDKYKRECATCWQALLKEAGIEVCPKCGIEPHLCKCPTINLGSFAKYVEP